MIGSHWYGASSHVVIDRFREAIEAPPPKPFNIMMFHGGLSTHVNELSGGVDYEVMLALRPCVQYLALGHIHKQYSMQNWLFNPGSLEVSKSREYDEPHGAYIGEIHLEDMSLHVTHHQDYLKRPFITLFCDCERYMTPRCFLEGVLQIAQQEGAAKIRHEKRTGRAISTCPPPFFMCISQGS
ncbi:MAG: hypothetical protein H6727_02770 [Myxococcales bacterium]|nr:hypothetical protein [Myxococcales bacterium]